MPTKEKTDNKILSFASLTKGWAYGSGNPPSEMAKELALSLNSYSSYLGFLATNAFPMEDGGVQFVVYNNEQEDETEYEFTINPNGEIDFAYIIAGLDSDFQECLSFEAAISKLEECALELCDLSASFTHTTTTKKNIDSAAPLLAPQTTKGFQLSTRIVLNESAVHYVSTCTSSTQTTLEVLLQSFGKSQSTAQPC